jgi:hypothetical protein
VYELSPEPGNAGGRTENRGAGHLFVARSDMEWFRRNRVGSINRVFAAVPEP